MGRLKICLLSNGLANQVFQYILSRYIEIKSGESVFFDDSLFWRRPVHNGYELERVFPNIKKPNLLSEFFSKPAWEDIIKEYDNKMLHMQLKDFGIEMLFVIEAHLQNYLQGGYFENTSMDWVIHSYKGKFMPMPTYSPALAYMDCNIYYYGFWVSEGYINEIRSEIIDELAFAPLTSEKNINYADQIQGTNSVAVHVRRGDFLELNWAEDSSYYARCVRAISEKISNPVFYMFSDDIEWCMTNVSELGLAGEDVVFIEGNAKEHSYIDLQLMSMCRAIVATPRSSFCRLAAVLSKNEDVLILR